MVIHHIHEDVGQQRIGCENGDKIMFTHFDLLRQIDVLDDIRLYREITNWRELMFQDSNEASITHNVQYCNDVNGKTYRSIPYRAQ